MLCSYVYARPLYHTIYAHALSFREREICIAAYRLTISRIQLERLKNGAQAASTTAGMYNPITFFFFFYKFFFFCKYIIIIIIIIND